MLFIHGTLSIGGIETFYMRFAKTSLKRGPRVKILLLEHEAKSNAALVEETRKYADVYFLSDFSLIPSFIARHIPAPLSLIVPLKKELGRIFEGVTQVHVSAGVLAFMHLRLLRHFGVNVPLTIGVYHSLEFTGRNRNSLPFYERKNRQLFFDLIDTRNIIFFYEKLIGMHEAYSSKSFKNVNIFPIGVVNRTRPAEVHKQFTSNRLIIGSVGRLAHFKSYNLWMLDVIKELVRRGIDVHYSIYGYGPLKREMEKRITDLGIQEHVELKGLLDYKDFNDTVKKFDIFVGSGTSIIEAANLGVPSIVGIEYITEPITYDYFAYLSGYSYNEDGLFEKHSVIDQISKFLAMSASEKRELSELHVRKANEFSMETCVDNMRRISTVRFDDGVIRAYSSFSFRLIYALSFTFFMIRCRLRGRSLAQVIYQ